MRQAIQQENIHTWVPVYPAQICLFVSSFDAKMQRLLIDVLITCTSCHLPLLNICLLLIQGPQVQGAVSRWSRATVIAHRLATDIQAHIIGH